MNKRLFCLLLGILSILPLAAKVQITLSSGQTIVGDILFENEEVVLVKTPDGTRYQYLRQDISSVSEVVAQDKNTEKVVRPAKKAGVAVQMMGGVAVLPAPQRTMGGFVAADLKVGACDLLGKRIFLGGAVGYHSFLLGGKNIGFVPLQISTEIPFLQGKHTPYVGIGMGYGFATDKAYKGGIYGNAEIGWRCWLHSNMALYLSCYSECQQGMFSVSENIGGVNYTRQTSLALCAVGAKLGVRF
ncbi:MAG TPA: hypothetical protein DIW30_00850 [Bacteroidales bacterium]|nr:hypothetical protein [Bacteroidales bacterium]